MCPFFRVNTIEICGFQEKILLLLPQIVLYLEDTHLIPPSFWFKNGGGWEGVQSIFPNLLVQDTH